MISVATRPACAADEESVVEMRGRLWPDVSATEHQADVRALLAGKPRSTLPLTILVAEEPRGLVGFIEVGLRSHADGCDPARPCGFVEGWYVTPSFDGRGVGRALMEAAERWCRSQGCTEIASDTWIENEASQHAHQALGFEVVDRCVNYRKSLAPRSQGERQRSL